MVQHAGYDLALVQQPIPWCKHAFRHICDSAGNDNMTGSDSVSGRVAGTAQNGSDGEREGLLTWCIAVPAILTVPPPCGHTIKKEEF